jgi:hypothetical protein
VGTKGQKEKKIAERKGNQEIPVDFLFPVE